MLCQMQLKKIKAVATKGRGFFCDRTSAVVFWDTVLEFEDGGEKWSVELIIFGKAKRQKKIPK